MSEQLASLERLGEQKVRYLLADITKRPNFDTRIAEEWLASKDRAAAAALEEEKLSVARASVSAAEAAASAAYWQARWAKWAAAIAAAIAIVTARSDINALIDHLFL